MRDYKAKWDTDKVAEWLCKKATDKEWSEISEGEKVGWRLEADELLALIESK